MVNCILVEKEKITRQKEKLVELIINMNDTLQGNYKIEDESRVVCSYLLAIAKFDILKSFDIIDSKEADIIQKMLDTIANMIKKSPTYCNR